MRRIPMMTESESRAHVKLMRLRGYHMRAVYLPDGSKLWLRSRKPIRCHAHHHCSAQAVHHKPKRRAKRRK